MIIAFRSTFSKEGQAIEVIHIQQDPYGQTIYHNRLSGFL